MKILKRARSYSFFAEPGGTSSFFLFTNIDTCGVHVFHNWSDLQWKVIQAERRKIQHNYVHL
jgi:hypothetical protein